MNSAMELRLEVIFAKRGTCGSCEQCRDPPKETQTRCYPNPLLTHNLVVHVKYKNKPKNIIDGRKLDNGT